MELAVNELVHLEKDNEEGNQVNEIGSCMN